MKTIDQLNEEMDAAIDDGDVEAMDRIAEEMAALSEPNAGAPDANDVADSAEEDEAEEADFVEVDDDSGSSAAQQDGKQAEGDDTPEGIATKSGKGVIPYAELERARQEAAELKEQLESMRDNPQTDPAVTAELDRLRRLTAAYEARLQENEIAAPVLPEEFRLDAEKLKELEEFGEIGQIVGMLAKQNEMLLGQIKGSGPAAQPEVKPQAAPNDPQAIVDANPDLSRWQRSDLAWEEVTKVDGYLKTLPDYSGKSLSERVPKIVEMVRQRLGEAPTKATPPPAPAKGPAPVEQKPNSLSDIGGATANQDASFAERTAEKSEAEIYEDMERMLASGKSMDDILSGSI